MYVSDVHTCTSGANFALWNLFVCCNFTVDGLLLSGKLSASKQKSPVSVTSTTSMSQLLKVLFGGVVDSRVNFESIVFDDLGVWTPDRVNKYIR